MAYEESIRQTQKQHGIILEERERLSVTGVEEVERFDEDEIVMRTVLGRLSVRGSGLHVGRLSLELGEVGVEGSVSELSYEEQEPAGGGLWRRIFS